MPATIEQQPGRQLQDHVGPVVSAGEPAERHRGNSKRSFERIPRNRKIHAVEIVDQNSDAQQERNRPPPARNFFAAKLCLWHGLWPFAVAIIAYPARAPTENSTIMFDNTELASASDLVWLKHCFKISRLTNGPCAPNVPSNAAIQKADCDYRPK